MKRISWKKGMRLTDTLFRRADEANLEMVGKACAMAAAGRMGLMPDRKPFGVTVSFGKGYVEVEAITCLAITRDGHVIDVDYGVDFTNNIEKRVRMPEGDDAREWLLAVYGIRGEWHETGDDYEVPAYGFVLLKPDMPLPDDAFPIARIVAGENGGWRVDDENFLPPCLFLSAHPRYEMLRVRMEECLQKSERMLSQLEGAGRKTFAMVFWPEVRRLMVTVDKERDLMTPMGLLAAVQQYVSLFVCACTLDGIGFVEEDTAKFEHFIHVPYTCEDAYARIVEGLGLVLCICEEKLVKITQKTEKKPEPRRPENRRPTSRETVSAPEPPAIDENCLMMECVSPTTNIRLVDVQPNVTIWFTVTGTGGEDDGVKKRARGNTLSFNNGFRHSDSAGNIKEVELTLWAEKNGRKSVENTSLLTLTMSKKFVDVPKI